MPKTSETEGLLSSVMRDTLGGEALASCLQCGTCGGSCPSGANMDHTPRQLFAMLMAGMDDEVLASNTPWYCVSCYYCTVRCPQNIPITDLMYTLKQKAISSGKYDTPDNVDFSSNFIYYVEHYGRSFEFGLATRYHLMHHPLGMLRKGELGFALMRRGRLDLTPNRIRNLPQLTAILDEAKRIAAENGG